ncbi:MAG TPA: hypothetical protein VE029_10180 [Rhizobacter sp.]|nr:hypothetical protein [Rhizobacter sp.]
MVRVPLLAVAALILFIEEWGWRPLTAWAARLAQWPPLARLEARIRGASPRWALAFFLFPAVLLFPIKLVALWLMHLGQTALGVLLIVAAKLLGTAFVGRLFVLTEPQLMKFAWFARALAWWRVTKARVREACRGSAAWRAAHGLKRRLRIAFRRLVRQSPQ